MIRRLTETDETRLVGKLLRLPLRFVPSRSVLRIRTGVNRGAKWIAGSSLHSCWLGTYEAEKQKLVESLTRPGMTVWDVGANAGFYTVAFSRLVHDHGRVYAFEPFAENADNILSHVQINELNNVTFVQAAMGSTNNLVGFSPGALNAMGRVSETDTRYLVPSVTAEGFVNLFPEAMPDLIKVDVEGGESDLLEGARKLLIERGPDLLLALHGDVQSMRCINILKELDYETYYLDGRPVDQHTLESDEVFARRKQEAHTSNFPSGVQG